MLAALPVLVAWFGALSVLVRGVLVG